MGIPCFDLIVYKDGECVLRHMGGYADPENKIPVMGKEKYHIYSCSKLITCAAAMQLWEKGMFSLEDMVEVSRNTNLHTNGTIMNGSFIGVQSYWCQYQ